jgi:hypothetical protein
MSWGYKILIFYGLFVGMMAALVIGSYQHKVNLVSKDYYEMELKYQDVIDGSPKITLLVRLRQKPSNRWQYLTHSDPQIDGRCSSDRFVRLVLQ